METKRKGDISEQHFIVLALERGFGVSRPIGDRLPYDCIVDVFGKLFKVQIKTAYITKYKGTEGLLFSQGARNSLSNKKAITYRWYSIGDFDVAAVFDPTDKNFFIIPGDLFILSKKTQIQYTWRRRIGTPNFGVYKNNWNLFNVEKKYE